MGHLITGVVQLNTKKSKVVLDHELELALYRGELRRFHIEEGTELTEKAYEEIMTQILPKRARERCLNLLAVRSMTEQEIRRKLRDGYYPEEIIDGVIPLLQKHHLVDDQDYAESFISMKKSGKSKRQIQQELMRKGVSSEIIRTTLEDSDINEEENIRRLMDKKGIHPEESGTEELQKFANFLLRKGYDYDLIRRMVFH